MSSSQIQTVKILLLGDSGVGKSSILLRYVEDKFMGEDLLNPTIGVDYKYKIIDKNGKKVKLAIWDTAGQEKFRTVTATYYRGAQGVVLVYDVSSRSSFENLRFWIQELENYNNKSAEVVKMIVGNKTDKDEKREVRKDEGMAFAKQNSALFIETSAKTKEGIIQCFDELLSQVLIQIENQAAANETDALRIDADRDPRSSAKSCGCL